MARVIMSRHSATHFLKHFLLSQSTEFGRDQNQVTSSYAKSAQLEQRMINERTQGNHFCLSLIRKTNIILTIIISSQTEYNDSVNDISVRMNLWSMCQHTGEKDHGDTWTHMLWWQLSFSASSLLYLLMYQHLQTVPLWGAVFVQYSDTRMPENIPMSQLRKVPLHGKENGLHSLGYLMFDTSLKLKTVILCKIVLSYTKNYKVSLGELARNT